jgi:signal transduction histidine kinase
MSDENSGVVTIERGVSPYRADIRLYMFIVDAAVTIGCLLFLFAGYLRLAPLRILHTGVVVGLLVGSFLVPGFFRVQNELNPTVARQLFGWRIGGGVLFATISVVREWIDMSLAAVPTVPSISVVAWGVIQGLVLGSIGGYLALQGRQEAKHADRLVEQTSVLNRVLRHDIRTSVNLIEGHLEMVDPGTEAEAEQLLQAVSEARELAALSDRARSVQQLLRNDQSTSLVDLGPFVEEIVEEVRETHPDVTVNVEGPDSALAATNPIITEAIRELVHNAIEHHDKPTQTITIELEEGERRTEVTVHDDGPGISAYESEILEHGAVTDLQHSSGMGLWLVRWVVDQSHGELEITSREPRGTSVTIRLPTP